MPSNLKISTQARNAAADAIVDLIDGGTGAGRIEIRTGSPPSSPSNASTGDLLGTLTFSNPAFGNAATGVATANSINSDTDADNSGTAGYFRVYAGAASDTSSIMQGTAGESGDTPDMIFNNASVVQGGIIAVDTFTVTMPES